MLFHFRHSRVISPHCIYVEFFGVFELFSPVHTKTPKQWKYGGMLDWACVLQCLASSYSKFFVFRSHENDKLAFLKNSTLGTVKILEIPISVEGNLNWGKNLSFQKYPGACGQGLKWVYEACALSLSNIYDQISCCISTWRSNYSYYHSSCITRNCPQMIV